MLQSRQNKYWLKEKQKKEKKYTKNETVIRRKLARVGKKKLEKSGTRQDEMENAIKKPIRLDKMNVKYLYKKYSLKSFFCKQPV